MPAWTPAAAALRERIAARRGRPRVNSLRLTGRLALFSALSLTAAAGLIVFVGQHGATQSAARAARLHASVVANSVLEGALGRRDLTSPVTASRRRQLDRFLRARVLSDGAVAVTIYGIRGRVTYATDHAQIGRVARDVWQRALARRVERVGVAPAQPGARAAGASTRDLLVTYVPLNIRGSPGGAALALYEARPPLAGDERVPMVVMVAILALALLALYIAILPIPRGLQRRLQAQLTEMDQMEHRAFHDTLTGLPNRALFHDRVEQALAAARRDGESLAVMLMDLDRFKEINDTFGHHSGDEVLEEVGQHLSRALRTSDTVARLGGDEFAILTPRVPGPMGAVALAQRAVDEVQRTHTVAGIEVDVDASIGIALFPHHGDDVEALLRCADIAMYESKVRGVPTLYAVDDDHHSADRLALGAQLRRAIARREIIVYYQPKADVRTGEVTAVEALVRWQHAERGLLSPDQFIPLAEQTGVIRPLTSHVLDCALHQCRRWRDEGLSLSVAVNITGRDLLDQRFAEEVKDLLRRWEVPPSYLELEITENTVLTDPPRARAVLATLDELGVRLAIDDFGSGNSSLGYLRALPIDVLKIDKSFVLQMDANAEDAAIVRSTIDLGHNLGLKVVAEGVESSEAWDKLRALGCDFAQGYYLGRPVPAGDVDVNTPPGTTSLETHRRHRVEPRTDSAPDQGAGYPRRARYRR